jgi:hypothetical protein
VGFECVLSVRECTSVLSVLTRSSLIRCLGGIVSALNGDELLPGLPSDFASPETSQRFAR